MARHPFTDVSKAYEILRRGGELTGDYRLLFERMLSQPALFADLLALVGKECRYDAYRMILERMLAGEELVCFEEDLAADLLETLAAADKQLRLEEALRQLRNQRPDRAFKRPMFSDTSFVTRAADRSPTIGHL